MMDATALVALAAVSQVSARARGSLAAHRLPIGEHIVPDAIESADFASVLPRYAARLLRWSCQARQGCWPEGRERSPRPDAQDRRPAWRVRDRLSPLPALRRCDPGQ